MNLGGENEVGRESVSLRRGSETGMIQWITADGEMIFVFDFPFCPLRRRRAEVSVIMPMRGRITFDYSLQNGIYQIGSGETLFETMWTRGGADSIHAYKDPPSIDVIALAPYAKNISDIRDASRPEQSFTSRVQQPKEGQILILRNVHRIYAALKILNIKSAGHGDAMDEITFDYVILEDGSRNFSEISNMQVIDQTFSKRVLLIGAGFSRNWGGLLANEVAGRLLAHPAIKARPNLRKLLLDEPSFEDALEKNTDRSFRSRGC